VRKHGGDIEVRSQEGEWIEFVFTLPRPDVLQGQMLGFEDLDDENDADGEVASAGASKGAAAAVVPGMEWLSAGDDDDDDDDGEWPTLIGGSELPASSPAAGSDLIGADDDDDDGEWPTLIGAEEEATGAGNGASDGVSADGKEQE